MRTATSRTIAAVRAAAAAAVSFTACGGGSSANSGKAFTVAVIEPDLTTVPILAALDTLREEGYDVKEVELAEPELAIEGLAKGQYAISAEATSPALIAAEQGAPIKIIADVVANQWAFYAQKGIESCDDLAGQPVGIFSEGAVATAMVKDWVADNCTDSEPEYLVIGGSDVRAQALQQGEIVATALEVADVATLADQGTPVEEPLVDFSDVLSDVHPQTVYANADFLENNADAAQAFMDAFADEHAKINADPSYLVDLVEEYLPESVSDSLQSTAEGYVEAGLFDATELTEENMQSTIDFFARAGVVSGDLSLDDAVDLSFSDKAKG